MRLQSGVLSKTVIAVSLAALFAGCGGGGSSGGGTPAPTDPTPTDPELQTGVFIDSAVANIGYRTATQQGVTSAEGEFSYVEGETVVFFIGDLEFPPVTATGVVTPLEIAGSDDVENPVVVNIARLLQSLDTDGDPANGIQIPAAAAEAAAAVDFSLPVSDFAALPAVQSLVANSGSVTTALIDADTAIGHLDDTLQTVAPPSLIGSWVAGTPGSANVAVLTFIDDTHYMIGNDEDDSDETGEDGIEYGTYSYNAATGAVTATPGADTNGEWGFSHLCGDATLTFSNNGNKLTLLEVGEGCDAPTNVEPQFTRVRSATNPLVGAWYFQITEEVIGTSTVVVTFLDDTHYMVAEHADQGDEYGQSGVEHGTYSIDATTDVLSVGELFTDTNGEWGFSHEEGQTLTVDADTLTFHGTVVEDDDAILTRLQ